MQLKSSFRDPGGFIFRHENVFYRQVNQSYSENYNFLINSGLYQALINQNLLIPHTEIDNINFLNNDGYKILKPEQLSFISYPYEWCFDQLKDAALTLLLIQQIALDFSMSLKDGTAYNIQFYNGKPIFIDTLSFEKYVLGKPWVAYKQFCEHFLAPLALMSYTDLRLSQLLINYIDGIPLDLVSKLLPFKTKLKFSLLAHIHLHANSQSYYSDKSKKREVNLSLTGVKNIIQNLYSSISNLKIKNQKTEWGNYYNKTNYSTISENSKILIVAQFIDIVSPTMIWDLGSNTGFYSRMSNQKNIPTISFDIDNIAVNINYNIVKNENESHILPLVLDITNPSPAIGWANEERENLLQRGPIGLLVSLALIHHLVISNNTPLDSIASYFSKLCKWLIIEFTPKSDSQVQRLLTTREDIFPDYTRENFELIFSKYFKIISNRSIVESERFIYLMKVNG